MANNRPGGRDVVHSGGTGSVNKKGSGLGTGPVGNVDYSGKTGGGRRSSSSNVTRGVGGGGALVAIAVVFFLIKSFMGGGSGSSGLSGITSGASTIMNLLGSGTSYETTSTDYSSASSTTVSSATDKKLDTTVAKGSRDKYTTIKGDGKDEITILVYMCGTDLESQYGMGTSDLKEMANATINSKVKIIVYTGGCKQWKTTSISSSVNQIYKIENGGLTCLEKDMGSKKMTDPSTLVEFINYGVKNYSSNRMCLIFWDHGGGSISGYGYDEKYSSAGSMTLAGIDSALKQCGVKFDFIGFDACLMATLENGLMLADYADYMIASEETEPGVGWYYTNWLTKLASNTSMPTIEIGKNIVDDFVTVCNQKCAGQKTTLSVVDLAELSATVPGPLTDFAKATSNLINTDKYQTVSDARANTREFAQSSKIDQIDLIDFANNLGTTEAKALATALNGAIKYNRTSSSITNSWGISIFFPYKKPEKVTNTEKIYNTIGMDSEYTSCIKAFASLEVSGQVSGGGSSSGVSSLLGTLAGTGSSGGSASSILSMLGGMTSSSSGLTSANGISTALLSSLFSDRSMSDEDTANYLANNYFDSSKLVWTEVDGSTVIQLTEDQWDLVQNIDLNVWYDDGEGYIDLGMDNVLSYDLKGNLVGYYDGSWLSINGQVVAYYRTSYADGVTEGYVPVMLNGQRAELNIVFDKTNPAGIITGVRYIYADGETETSAKNMMGLEKGDKLEFICDYYDYKGNYKDSYILGDAITLGDTITIANITISDKENLKATYCFTDIYQERYWTPEIK